MYPLRQFFVLFTLSVILFQTKLQFVVDMKHVKFIKQKELVGNWIVEKDILKNVDMVTIASEEALVDISIFLFPVIDVIISPRITITVSSVRKVSAKSVLQKKLTMKTSTIQNIQAVKMSIILILWSTEDCAVSRLLGISLLGRRLLGTDFYALQCWGLLSHLAF